MTINDIHITYKPTGASQQANEIGVRVMSAQRLLEKSFHLKGFNRSTCLWRFTRR